MPHKAWALEQAGAAGQIYIHGDHIHELIVTTIWGTPTPESAHRLPRTPVVSIRGTDGARLKAMLAGGPVRVRLRSETWTGWRTVPIVTGTIAGAFEPDRFVLVSCHLDSWYHGAMDNGAANAVALELVRILAPRRDRLRRSLRVAFWPGHSNARYAGSTWYADNRWEELHDRCVVHVNIESPGAAGSVPADELVTMAANRRFAEDLFFEMAGKRAVGRRFGRTGEQSFWGVGIPALFVTVSMWPSAQAPDATRGILAHMTVGGGEGGLPWWWHTPHDTIDKIDPDLLLRDARVYVATAVRLCNAPVLPFDPVATADEILGNLEVLQDQAGDRFDLSQAADRARQFREAAAALRAAADALAQQIGDDAGARAEAEACRIINDALMAADRALIPVCFTVAGPFDHDPAVPLPPLPGLSRVRDLAAMDPASDQFGFLLTRLVRERTRLLVALREAHHRLAAALARLGQAHDRVAAAQAALREARDRLAGLGKARDRLRRGTRKEGR
jgi:hypothetical protein